MASDRQLAAKAKRFAVWREMQDVRDRTMKQMADEIGIGVDTFRLYMAAQGLKMPPRSVVVDDLRDENEVPVDEMIGAEPERRSAMQELFADRRRLTYSAHAPWMHHGEVMR